MVVYKNFRKVKPKDLNFVFDINLQPSFRI